jgi:hypothetical protein
MVFIIPYEPSVDQALNDVNDCLALEIPRRDPVGRALCW